MACKITTNFTPLNSYFIARARAREQARAAAAAALHLSPHHRIQETERGQEREREDIGHPLLEVMTHCLWLPLDEHAMILFFFFSGGKKAIFSMIRARAHS